MDQGPWKPSQNSSLWSCLVTLVWTEAHGSFMDTSIDTFPVVLSSRALSSSPNLGVDKVHGTPTSAPITDEDTGLPVETILETFIEIYRPVQ